MIKLHAQLEQALKVRINSNNEIIPAIKNLLQSGKLDKPKEIAMFAIILDRLGELEDQAAIENSLSEITDDTPIIEESTDPNATPIVSTPIEAPIVDQSTLEEPSINPSEPTSENLNPTSEANPSTPESQPLETTVSEFTPENVKDPTPDSTTAA